MNNQPARHHPLGPIAYRTTAGSSRSVRCQAAAVLLAAAFLITVAAHLSPSPSGTGTHTQLGQPPCSWMKLWNIPCPTCGMTTAFAHTVRGQLLSALIAQPAGMLLAINTLLAAMWAGHALITGRAWKLNWYRVRPLSVVLCAVVVVILSWVYKVLATCGSLR